MGLKDLRISVSYETTESNTRLLDEFYNPVLEQAVKYYRVAGFFSSTALSVAAKGIGGLVRNGGKMYLLVSPELSEEDYRTIREHNAVSDTAAMFDDLRLDDVQDENLQLLAWLLDSGSLEIKIAVGQKDRNSLFHQKVGIVTDAAGDMISFSGSINETAQAWLHNIEEFKVFKSWEQGQLEYLRSDLSKFLDYWKNKRPEVAMVYDIPEAVRAKIIKVKPRDVWDLDIMRKYKQEQQSENNKLSLFPHQQAAVRAWVSNGYSLLMEMATGVGKTRTAIGCMLEKLKDKETLLTIVATPQNTLSRQWRNDLIKLGIQLDKEAIIDGSNPNWKKDLEFLMLDLSDGKIRTAIVFTTAATASDDKFIRIVRNTKYSTKILFIADEAHTTGASKQRKALLEEYEYRIGLSATPQRLFDEEGSSLIREYFGGKSFEFTIADALHTVNPVTGQPFLNAFEYHPIFVPLTAPETQRYERVNRQIAILKNKDSYDPDDLQKLYDRRADISKNAENKIGAFEELIRELNPANIHDTIVFVSDKQIEKCLEILGSMQVKRSKITESESASKVVNKEGETERQQIISQFARHQIQVLVGIKCLDEGIDIPNANTAILLSSSTNPREYIQRVGRVIRQAPGKPTSRIYDFIVLSAHSSHTPFMLEKEGRRAFAIAQNAVNFQEVKQAFLAQGVDIDVD